MRIRNQRHAHLVSLDAPTASNLHLDIVGSHASPEDELGWREVVELLRSEMLRMPSLFRDVMVLHDREQLPIYDVAERLGLSVPATKSRLSRARKELGRRVGKHCGRKGSATLLEKTVYNRIAYRRAS
jgi:DNA-directed RNA polymerase specialized sigma24 family protein